MGIGYDLTQGIATTPVVGEGGIFVPAPALAPDVDVDDMYISPWVYDSEVQGTWTLFMDDTVVRRAGVDNTSSLSSGDEVLYKDYIRAGTYTVKLVGVKGSSYGIIKIKVDDAVIATFDMYNVDALVNQIVTQTDIAIGSSGVKEIKVGVDGKNASSSGYACIFNEVVFYRTV